MSFQPQSSEHPEWDDIDLYLAGSADADTSCRVKAYFAEHPEREAVIRKHVQPSADKWQTEDMLTSLHERIAENESLVTTAFRSTLGVKAKTPGRVRFTFFRNRTIALAAGLAAGAVTVVGVWLGISQVSSNRTKAPAFEMTYQTHNAQQSTILLNDGTRVILNVKSALYIPEDFGQGTRVVRLEGEAFFDVTHHGNEPFVVETAKTRNTVLGTEFSVRAYPGEDAIIAVRSGRIAVNRTVVGQEEMAMVDLIGLVTVVRDDVERRMGFAEGKLILRDISLGAALVDLERWYDVKIQLANPVLGKTRINATLFAGTIEDLEEMLRLTFDVRVERESRLVTVYAE